MPAIINEKISHLKADMPQTFMLQVTDDLYPAFSYFIYRLEDQATVLKKEQGIEEPLLLLQSINNEFEELYRKEKHVLFPYLLRLESDSAKSENCTPFKSVKRHYTAILSLINELKCRLSDISADGSHLNLADQLLKFERQQIEFQKTKERLLFARYRSCPGCKVSG